MSPLYLLNLLNDPKTDLTLTPARQKSKQQRGRLVWSLQPHCQPFLLVVAWKFTSCLCIAPFAIDGIKLWAFLEHLSLPSQTVPSREDMWASIQYKAPHVLGFPSILRSNPSLCVAPIDLGMIKPSPEPVFSSLKTSSLFQSHNLQHKKGGKSLTIPQILVLSQNARFYQKSRSVCFDYYHCFVTQQKWAVMDDLKKQAKPFHTPNEKGWWS